MVCKSGHFTAFLFWLKVTFFVSKGTQGSTSRVVILNHRMAPRSAKQMTLTLGLALLLPARAEANKMAEVYLHLRRRAPARTFRQIHAISPFCTL